MIARKTQAALLVSVLVQLACASARAENVIEHLPPNALGLLVAQDLEQVDAKVQQFCQMFSIEGVPSPLIFLNFATGLKEGLDGNGDVMLALLPSEDLTSDPIPLLLLPVTDYAKFVAPIEGDASGEICRITIAGEEVLVARLGKFALLMNLEHRENMQQVLADEPGPVAALKPLASWIDGTDLLAIIMPEGVKQLTALGRQAMAAEIEQLQAGADNDELDEFTKPAAQIMDMYDGILKACGSEVELAGLGVSFDKEKGMRVTQRVLLSEQSELARLPAVAAPERSPLADYQDQSIVAGGGGPLPAEWASQASAFVYQFMKENPGIYGLEGLDEQQWKKAQESWQGTIDGLRSVSWVVLPGTDDEPVYSNFYSVMKVENSQEYLETYKQAVESWNEVMAQSTSDMQFHYDLEETTVGDAQGLLLSMDLLKMMGPQEHAMVQQMMKAMFGGDGKMRVYLLKIDEDRILAGVASEVAMAKVLKFIEGKESRLTQNSHIQTTLGQLDQEAQWMGVVRPQGVMQWFERMMNIAMQQFGGGMGMPQFAEYPDAPPAGFSLKLEEALISGDVVWPTEGLNELAKFIKAMEDAN
ncbi:hypothetical protein [Adhaeretor mobilis]|uniref:DUF3352 domain-containing protein n=1 Tax=Adhaeretor mobilis TaxID=1930276 RepID=A0A517MXA6_9BACT|nr:hypothetical protein [Adhaeretor mobilis]QDS99512.1 hypothetical protein HG15A2_28360 [Adhaeretor mobilis]